MAETQEKAALKSDEKLDDIMLAMDVVDTLRHERFMVEKELAGEDRREALIKRLRGIYQAQGIDVPDEVLMDGVMALEEQRFVYEPPSKGLGTSLARLYVNRRKWLPLFYTLGFIMFAAFGINYYGFEQPKYDQIIGQLRNTSDKDIRQQLIEQAENRLAAERPFIPLYFYVSRHLVNPELNGYRDNLADKHLSRYLSF